MRLSVWQLSIKMVNAAHSIALLGKKKLENKRSKFWEKKEAFLKPCHSLSVASLYLNIAEAKVLYYFSGACTARFRSQGKGLYHNSVWSANYSRLQFLLLIPPFITFLSLLLLSDTFLPVNSVFHLLAGPDYSGPDDDAAARPIRTIRLLLLSQTLTLKACNTDVQCAVQNQFKRVQ